MPYGGGMHGHSIAVSHDMGPSKVIPLQVTHPEPLKHDLMQPIYTTLPDT